MAKEITSSVAAIEAEAEKMLAEARTRASDILLEAKEEVKKVLSYQLPLAEVKAECDKLVGNAKAEADRKVKDSETQAAEVSIHADKKAKELTELLVNIVRGHS